MKTRISGTILTIFLVIGLAQGAAAGVLETGKCSPAAEVRAALTAEGQNPIVLGNRKGYGYTTALIFMSNADGSQGYLVRGDRPLGEQAWKICVDSVFRDVRLNDTANPATPAWAKLGGDAETAKAICKRDKLGFQEECGAYEERLNNILTHGHRVLLMVRGSVLNPRDKTMLDNQRIVVTIDPSDQAGLVSGVTSEGANYILSGYAQASFTQHGDALLKKRRYN